MTNPFQTECYGNGRQHPWKGPFWLILAFLAAASSLAFAKNVTHTTESNWAEVTQVSGEDGDDEPDDTVRGDLCEIIIALGGSCDDMDHQVVFELARYTDAIYRLTVENGVPRGENGPHSSLVEPLPSAYRQINARPDRFGDETAKATLDLLEGVWSESGGDPTSLGSS